MTLSGTGHPEDVPAERIAALEDSSERELRERSDGTDEARGPFAYRVKWEPHIDDEGVGTDGTISGKSMRTGGDSDD